MSDNTLWSRLPLEHCPSWLRPLLLSTQARLVEDSDALMWRYEPDRAHLQIDVDKLLMYSTPMAGGAPAIGPRCDPLSHRTYYSESAEEDKPLSELERRLAGM